MAMGFIGAISSVLGDTGVSAPTGLGRAKVLVGVTPAGRRWQKWLYWRVDRILQDERDGTSGYYGWDSASSVFRFGHSCLAAMPAVPIAFYSALWGHVSR